MLFTCQTCDSSIFGGLLRTSEMSKSPLPPEAPEKLCTVQQGAGGPETPTRRGKIMFLDYMQSRTIHHPATSPPMTRRGNTIQLMKLGNPELAGGRLLDPFIGLDFDEDPIPRRRLSTGARNSHHVCVHRCDLHGDAKRRLRWILGGL